MVEQMYSETMKGQDALHPSVSPEQFVDLIIASVSGMELADADSLGGSAAGTASHGTADGGTGS